MIVQIIILAMIAAFLGLRLYAALGRRAEHEEESIPTNREITPPQADREQVRELKPAQPRVDSLPDILPATERAIHAIAAADRNFDITTFVEGAKSAYGMVLDAFWQGDRETLRELCDDDVFESFDGAITARDAAGETLDNRLIRIEETRIEGASLNGSMARIAVRFVADIAAVTRDSEGNVVAGSLDDAIVSRDVWTFMRDVHSPEPGWLLDETDEG